ncbi:MAG: hypothetical protein JG781_1075 [Peptococcaceae bacterium]|jgi:hypothetical protein|nr:hypothetical protein [Peptococcaceae bacterium]
MPNRTVAVQPGLTEVKEKLEQHGFNVVDIADTRANITAMVYSSEIHPEEYEAQSMLDESIYNSTGSSDGYVLMLNAAEMTADEIVARIRTM